MTDWDAAPRFGVGLEGRDWVVRPSAYALVHDSDDRLALVVTGQGTFLPGGGIEAGEEPEEAVVREALEECALIVKPGAWTRRAIEFVYSTEEQTHFEKRSIFIEADPEGVSSVEPEHELVWATVEQAVEMLSHQSHGWAVERWSKRTKRD